MDGLGCGGQHGSRQLGEIDKDDVVRVDRVSACNSHVLAINTH